MNTLVSLACLLGAYISNYDTWFGQQCMQTAEQAGSNSCQQFLHRAP